MGRIETLFRFLAGICFILMFVGMVGCGGQGVHGSPVQTVTANYDPEEPPVETVHENLSMAGELRNAPRSEYVLGPEDELEISVFRRDEMQLKVGVSQTGKISYYLLGDIDVSGLTQFELRDLLEKALAEYVKEPKVVVRILAHKSHKVYVLGQFRNPGVYRIIGDYTLLEAVSEAGGLREEAYLGGAYVVRGGEILLVNFVELIEKGNMGENIPLVSGDLVYVPSNKDQRIYVLGEVNRQSTVMLRDGLTLLGAVAEAGGFTRDARKDTVVVMRGNLSKPEIMKVNLEGMNPFANIVLERGDIVYVASTTFANVERIAVRVSNILRPFYDLTRTVVWGDAAVQVMEGKDSRFIAPDSN